MFVYLICLRSDFAEHRAQAELQDAEDGFGEDASRHFARAELTVDEDDRDLDDFELALESLEFHLYLESVSFELDFVKVYCLKYVPSIADETGCRVAQVHTGHKPHICRSEI